MQIDRDKEEILRKVIANEGGYIFDKNDSGGETYKGITRKYFPDWNGWEIVDSLKDKNEKNEILDRAVMSFYEDNFYNKLRLSEITSYAVKYNLLDTAVNTGKRTSIKLIQASLSVVVDGIIGSKTLYAINMIDEEKLILRFKLAKIARYSEIASRYTKNIKFLIGWINRTLGA